MADRFLMLFASEARPALLSHLTVASLTLAAVLYAAPAIAQHGEEFIFTPPPGMVAMPVTNRQFDTGYGVSFTDGSIPVAGTSTHPCQIGFKLNAANNHLSRAEINRTTSTAEWRSMVRGIIGMVFAIQGERAVTVQGYRGIELKVMPKAGTGASEVRGLMTMVETPKGRMTSVCMTTATAFPKAEPRFRALPRGARLPE